MRAPCKDSPEVSVHKTGDLIGNVRDKTKIGKIEQLLTDRVEPVDPDIDPLANMSIVLNDMKTLTFFKPAVLISVSRSAHSKT